ncbi:MAG: glycosyltransferase family 2 protein, partial [Candidatus Dojkabacteria bacterium]
CLRLIYFLEQPGHERYAVVQTPYSSFRGAASRIERIAGATTDIQHILHQGMTYYGATFWVGANAIIRKIALEDIVEKEIVGGFEIKRYIQDRTVIEDTESSVDLVIKDWKLMNYPERLSYSATPSDFGSLIIQRRRWANGGLLMLNKLWESIRYRKQKNQTVPWAEVIHRLNYMASIAWSSFGLIWLLIFPFDGNLLSPLVLLAALPYFISMAYDLKYNGYNYLDIFGIYGFNLILLPVNLAGVLKSIEQGITGKKIPFARTPKVNNRTASSLEFLLIPIGIVLFSLYIFALNISNRNWGNAIFAAFNALTATWAILAYIGIDTLIVDIWHGITNWLFIEVTPRVKTTTIETKQPTLDWQTVLYSGEKNGEIPYTSLNNLVVEENKVKKRNI